MGLPTSDDNEYGYNNTDITRNAESFKNKLFLLIHGNADDNVHYQQSMLLAKALENADVMFQQIVSLITKYTQFIPLYMFLIKKNVLSVFKKVIKLMNFFFRVIRTRIIHYLTFIHIYIIVSIVSGLDPSDYQILN